MKIFDDWSQAAAHNGTYSIHPSQNHTGYPTNIDDIDLVEGQPVRPKSPDEYTVNILCLVHNPLNSLLFTHCRR